MHTPITLETPYCKFTFVQPPKQVKKVAELPNWFITLGDPNTHKPVKVYLQIQHNPADGMPHDTADVGRNVIDYIVSLLKDPNFIAQFGQLVLNTWMQKAPTESENYRVSKEFYNFFQRRGRDLKSSLAPLHNKCNAIKLAMDSDVVFNTSCSNLAPSRRRGITGQVSILGQHHYFSLQHPLFDLSTMMTGTDARKDVTRELRKAFPFIAASDIKGWTFDTHVQGK